jgi:hypothetical protein
MRFPFNSSDPVVKELVKYAGSEEICEQAMHNAHKDTKGNMPVKIDLIIKHILLLKDSK